MKKIYIKVPWIDGSDADYFVFEAETIGELVAKAARYIKEEFIEEFVMSTEVMDIPENDYTFQV